MLWRLDAKGIFLVKSFYDVLLGYQGKEEGWKKFWHKLVSPRFLVFCWLVRNHKI